MCYYSFFMSAALSKRVLASWLDARISRVVLEGVCSEPSTLFFVLFCFTPTHRNERSERTANATTNSGILCSDFPR